MVKGSPDGSPDVTLVTVGTSVSLYVKEQSPVQTAWTSDDQA